MPVLALAHDGLDSQDALQLWSVFSKCKNQLQEGRRLENISWRLAFRDLTQNKRLVDGPWPPTPESVCSDDSAATKSSSTDITSSSAATSTMTTPALPAGRIICDMIPPGLTQKLTQNQKDTKKDSYPTPASSSSSKSSGSASSSAVSIAVESPAPQQDLPEVDVPKVVVLTPTPNLTPHPTPPATPLLAASAPPAPRALAPPTPSSPGSSAQTRRDPPGPLFLPRSATRGMGSPVFSPVDSAYAPAPQASYAPQSTHILPLGGAPGPLTSSSVKTAARGTGSKFYLAAHTGTSGSSHSSSRSSGTSNSYENEHRSHSSSSSGSDSSRERGEGESTFVHGPERGLGNARGRGRGQARNGGRRTSSSEEVEPPQVPQQQPQQQKPPPEVKQKQQPVEQPPQAPQPLHPKQQQQQQQQQQQPQPQQKPPRAASAPFLAGVGLGLEMTPRTEAQVNGRQPAAPAPADADDARSVSSLATSSSHLRMRGGTRVTGHGKEGSGAQQFGALGLPSNLAAATALVERTMGAGSGRRKVILQTSDEEDGEWSDDEDESAEGAESVEGEVEGEAEQDDEEWEDEESENAEQSGVAANAKAPPPSLQQQPPPHLGHSRGHSTGGTSGGTDLRQLPSRPHRSAGHLPALANAGAAPAKHHHTTSAQNARTVRALKATMSATTISSAMLEAQRQRELFAKAPRISYENLTQLASSRPGGLTLLLGGGRQSQPGVAEQYQQQQQQLQQQNGVVPSQRPSRPGGIGGLGLHMSAVRPPPTGGAELSPIPPTPATAVQQQHQQPAARRQQQPQPQAPAPPSPKQQQHQQQQPAPLRRPPMMPRALSSSALPPHFGGGVAGASGSLGKSSVAEPVVSVGGPDVLGGRAGPAAAVASGSTTTQNGSTSAGAGAEWMEYDDDDEESDADGRSKVKGRDDGQLSQSVAQERLRVFLSRAKTGGPNGASNGVDSAEAERRRLYEQAGVVPWAAAANQHNVVPDYVAEPPPNRSMSTAPVGFPYNLPAPAPPSTPRTTRQQMLRNEMSESLRHNLLWQRKLSRTDTIGPQPRRTKSTVNVPSAVLGAGQVGRLPEKSLVRVTPRAPGVERRETLPPMDPPVPEGGGKKKLVRNLSWANTSDYHARGW
ncbi:hypothetical protein MVEN_02434400 [Mycena venus]|uniref:Nitrogen regulatory protein areA GATA-like domain-containing protein n=1 Tax=Mycena venus TaxID=2733690 RepID=A0A8H6WYC7_9AGAR|nr:hypothetical protein MVEN_02434400 [Mycena venus]